MRAPGRKQMRRFWDRRARENAPYFIYTGHDRDDPGLERFWATGERDVDWMLGRLAVEIGPEDRVVEIGCGIGRMTRALAKRAGFVAALDLSPEMIRRARVHNRELANVDWLVGDGRTLAAIEDASADACLSFVVFQHVPDPQVTLGYVREIGRVLRPGGWAAIQVSDRSPGARGRAALRRVAWPVAAIRGSLPRGWAHHPAWRGSDVGPERLREPAESGGMRLQRVEGAGTQYCCVLLRRLS